MRYRRPQRHHTLQPTLHGNMLIADYALRMLFTASLLQCLQRLDERRRSKQQAHTAAAASAALDALWQSFAALIAAAQQQSAAVAQLSDALLVVADAALGAVLHRHVPLKKRAPHSSKEAATAQQVLIATVIIYFAVLRKYTLVQQIADHGVDDHKVLFLTAV
jgi:hypothetical protein